MSTLPGTITGDIQWFEDRLAAWAEDPDFIGLTTSSVADIISETTEARAAFVAANAAKNAAKDATITQSSEVSDMRTLGGQLIKTIRAYAITQPDPSAIYAAASVPPQQAPSSVPPEQPTDITYALNTEGQIVLNWKGSTTGGTVFGISRSVQSDPAGGFSASEQIGIVGNREFVDTTIPGCTYAAQYIIRAYKGTFAPAVSSTATVKFTAGADGDTGNIKIAA